MDIKVKENGYEFKYRVCGLLKHGDKYLVVRMNDNPFYCLPGGHVELGEDTETAVRREMEEELGFKVNPTKLIAVNQNFYFKRDNTKMHEVGFYYIVEAVNPSDVIKTDYEREELDKGKIIHLEFKWLKLEDFKNVSFRPEFLKDIIEKPDTTVNIFKEY